MVELWPVLQMWHAPDGWGWWMVFGMLWMVVFWGGLLALLAWGLSRLVGGSRPAQGPGDTALEIARQRYARGEISREEFEELRRNLTQ